MSALLRPSNLVSNQPALARNSVGQGAYDHAAQVYRRPSSDDGRVSLLKDPKDGPNESED